MSKNITDYTFGKPLRFGPDYVFKEADLEDTDVFTSGVATSETFYPGKTQNAVAVVVEVDEEVTTAASTGELAIEYLYGDSFAKTITILAVGHTETLDPGEVIRFVPPAGFVDSPARIKISHTGGEGVLSVFPIHISR